jgi:hypothetical protein
MLMDHLLEKKTQPEWEWGIACTCRCRRWPWVTRLISKKPVKGGLEGWMSGHQRSGYCERRASMGLWERSAGQRGAAACFFSVVVMACEVCLLGCSLVQKNWRGKTSLDATIRIRYYTRGVNGKGQVRDGEKTQNRGMHHERVRCMDGRIAAAQASPSGVYYTKSIYTTW